MPIALRPRSTASTITSSNGAHALARPGVPRAATDSESVIASLAGFGSGRFSESVIASLAGFGRPHRPGARTATPAALKYAPAVSRRTPVASSIRRKLQPRRPNTSTCFCFSSLKTLAILGAADQIRALPSTSRSPHRWPLLIRSPMAAFDRSSRVVGQGCERQHVAVVHPGPPMQHDDDRVPLLAERLQV